MNLIELHHMPIFEQLQLEEALLRADTGNYLLINRGSSRAIVMGLSGKPEELLNLERVRKDKIPIIKRFSGGGTVVVDENTLFISFICSKEHLGISPFPEPILRWTEALYQSAWNIPDFSLQAQDYLSKDRFVHHTSFLWDFSPNNMDYLLLPKKRPEYRRDRSHEEFLCRLKDLVPTAEDLIQALKKELVKRFELCSFALDSTEEILGRNHRKATHFI
jgi:lipoate-protein ligase A